ncbi:MAG TPA: rhomboid family intramembrane serine protease [Gemmatimonadaceae bacterium]|nr:rhomboid family intramembrane serine protease [Gemmatimonadaceae bacterium]
MTYSPIDDQDYPRMTPAVQWIIALNVAVFFVQMTGFVGPADMRGALAFAVSNLTTRPWTIVTYMFVHADIWHLLGNMWMLFVFGPRVEHAWGTRSFAFYYVLCGLGGWLAHLLLVHNNIPLLGASAAIFGVMLAYAMRWPDDEVRFFPFVFIALKVRWFVLLLAGMNLMLGVASMAGNGAGVAYFAHLGGFGIGWLYLRLTSGPSIDRLRQRMSQIPDVPDEPPRAIPRAQGRSRERTSEIDEIVARSNALVAKRPTAAASLSSKVGKKKSEELNLVLDKISARGLDSLTSDERRLLEELSRHLRGS